MRTHVVRSGESPASIAILYAGCPKCSIDLIKSNSGKPTVIFPNSYITFQDLRVGETLNLPDKWFSREFDALPPAYFASLPSADGVTPGRVPGALGDQAALAAAQALVEALPTMTDQAFTNSVGSTGAAIDRAVGEAYGSSNAQAAQAAQKVQDGTKWAWARNADLAALIGGGASSQGPADSIQQAREEIYRALATALGDAQSALAALATPELTLPTMTVIPATPVPQPGSFPPAVQAAAQAVAAALVDPSYCATVGQVGSAVNVAVHNFKLAWNATQSPKVPIGTGNYEAATALAVGQVLGSAPPACGVRAAPSGARPAPIATRMRCPAGTVWNGSVCAGIAPQPKGLSTAAVVGIGLASAAVVGGVAYYATRSRRAAHR
jgi:hypothetical protein